MRELLFKNMTSNDQKKRDIFVQETVVKNGTVASSERRCLYFIKDRINIASPSDLAKLAEMRSRHEHPSRRIFITKIHDSKSGVDKLMCKLLGTFYAVVGRSIFFIVFVHSFKVELKAVPQGKK